MEKLKSRIHNHPKMERDKDLDEYHVIIDRELYLELLKKFGNLLVIGVERKTK